MTKKNIKLKIEYDGTAYSGWQRQKNATTIQELLEDSLHRITGENITLIAAGRTDTGVHARGQVANFFTSSNIPAERFSFALNSLLPKDIVVQNSELVSDKFHSRYSANAKRYSYTIILSDHGVAVGRNYVHHIRRKLDIELMREASRHFLGEHDFVGFMSTGSSIKNTVRKIEDINLLWNNPCLRIDFLAQGFLYNMVRIMVGTLIDVGAGKILPSDIPGIINSCKRELAGATAPSCGLCLEEVYY